MTVRMLQLSSESSDCFGVSKKKKQSTSERMGLIGETMDSIKSFQFRQALSQAVSLGIIVMSALIIWKTLTCITGSPSPIVVVVSGSMEPGFKKGDVLFLHMSKDPIRVGEIVVFDVKGRDIPIVHRVIKDLVILLSALLGTPPNLHTELLPHPWWDNNPDDDRGLYAPGQLWIQQHDILGRAVGLLPYVGWVTIIMTEKPIIKYILVGALGLFVITSKD